MKRDLAKQMEIQLSSEEEIMDLKRIVNQLENEV